MCREGREKLSQYRVLRFLGRQGPKHRRLFRRGLPERPIRATEGVNNFATHVASAGFRSSVQGRAFAGNGKMHGTSNIGGLSTARLKRMQDVMAGHVSSGGMPGMVLLVSRYGEVHADAIGNMAIGGAPMERDTIFRIASMTKPVAAVAAMILVVECKLRLDDPVDAFLPEL